VADIYTNSNSCVLEFGGGSGAVSAIVQKKLSNPSNHVVIQPKEGGMFGGVSPQTSTSQTCDLRTKKADYRLGDMVKGILLSEKRGKDWHIRTYPKSIVAEYFHATRDKENIEVLASIVKKRSEQLPAIQGCALHLRVGDVIETSSHSILELLSEPRLFVPGKNWSQYVPCWNKIEQCLDHRDSQGGYITIFAGTHSKDITNFPKSCQYIDTIQRLLEQKGYSVSRRLGEDPDEDFVLMTTAPYFIQSGGGYSKLISDVRKKLGMPNCKATL
jgi:hypothetical protein